MTVLLPVEFPDVPSKFVVDTGSAVTVLSRSVYHSIPKHKRPPLQPCSGLAVRLELANKEWMDVDGWPP